MIGASIRTYQRYEEHEERLPLKKIEKIKETILRDYKSYFDVRPSLYVDDTYVFPLLNVKASAGKGTETYKIEVIDSIVLDKIFFKTAPNVNEIKIVQVLGDSMEPSLKSGDYVLIDESQRGGIDGIYAISLHGQILIKRLKFKLDGTIVISSDNQEYGAEIYNPNETQIPLHVIGRKILTIQR